MQLTPPGPFDSGLHMNEVSDQAPSVLLVDDDPDQLALVTQLLEHAGFTVQTAADALSGFALAKESSPDLVISDVTMPRIDGFEFCNMIRAHQPLSTTPVLLLSAIRKDTGSVVEGLKLGADDYVEIPFEPAVLIAKASRLVAVNRMAEKLHGEKERLRFAISAPRMALWKCNILPGKLY